MFFQDASASNQGHEDLDQAFSQQAALICRHVFDTPEQVTEIMDTMCRPNDPGEQARKKHKTHKVQATAAKLDEVADWKQWVSVVGLHLKGLRTLFVISCKKFCLPLNFQICMFIRVYHITCWF